MRHPIANFWLALAVGSAVFAARPAAAAESLRLPPGDAAFFATLDLDRTDLADVKRAVNAGDWKGAEAAWAAHLQGRATPRWVWSRHDRDAIGRVFADHYGGLGKFVPEADRVLARQFAFLGVPKTLARAPQWDQGKQEWTHVLSRFPYFATLGKAYWATHDPKYANDFVYLFARWAAENPAPDEVAHSWSAVGSRWRTLETGIRGCGLFDDLELFMDAPAFDAAAKTGLTRSLVEHARRLYAHETAYHRGNWQVCECTGLACIGIMLPECREAAQWRERGLRILADHMRQDVYPDGGHSELTPGYHAWVTREFALISRLCRLNDVPTPPGMLDRHERMYEFLMNLAKPDRITFPVGDAGRGEDIAPDMAAGTLLYGRRDMRWLGSDTVPEDLVWLFGPDVVGRYAALPGQPPDPSSHLMPDSHLAVMRTGWNRADKALLFNCAPWGGGHNHRDRLEVCLYAGRDLLLDPGQISYDQPLSSTYFRTSAAHNVMTVDGQELPTAEPTLHAWRTTPSADFASASLDYAGIRQQRAVLFVRPDYWIVVDRASAAMGGPPHTLLRRFHFCPGDARTDGPAAYTTTAAAQPQVAVIDAGGTPARIEQGWVPSGGATAAAGPVAVFENREPLPAVHCTVLVPLDRPDQRPVVDQSAGPDSVDVRVRFPNGRTDRFVIGNGERPAALTVADHHANAWAIGQSTDATGTRQVVVGP